MVTNEEKKGEKGAKWAKMRKMGKKDEKDQKEHLLFWNFFICKLHLFTFYFKVLLKSLATDEN